MAFPGAYLTILYSLLLHFTIFGTNSFLLNLLSVINSQVLFSLQGAIYISYPVIGLLADVIKVTRYRMICFSYWLIFGSHLVLLILSISFFVIHRNDDPSYVLHIYKAIIEVLIVFAICGKGMFESTVIQFGIDQMIEASSSQLSSFIHWYYWSLHVGIFGINSILPVIGYLWLYNSSVSIDDEEITVAVASILLSFSILQCIACIIMFPFLFHNKFKKFLNIERAGNNPLKQIIDVLKYAYHHKYPERRSALTYYKNTYLSRLDFGKIQYGGPFTNEQVENTKTTLKLFILLLSLTGFFLSSDGFAYSNYIFNKACPSTPSLYYFVANPSLVSNIFILLATPCIHFFIKSSYGKYFPNMLKRMWLGLLLMLVQDILTLIISTTSTAANSTSNSTLINISYTEKSPSASCYACLMSSNLTEDDSICNSTTLLDYALISLVIPRLLHSLGYILTFMTALEFICAQVHHTLKGFMIGIWYSLFSVKYILICTIGVSTYSSVDTMLIFHGVKIGFIALSLVTSGIGCRWYRYHERDEVINIQGMIESIFEKELGQQNSESSNEEDNSIIQILSYTKPLLD